MRYPVFLLHMWLGLGKLVLFPMSTDLIFHQEHNMNNYLISQLDVIGLLFASCFSQSVCAVWGLNGPLVSLGMAVFGCTATWL